MNDKVNISKGDRKFELSLPATVFGINSLGEEFSEETELLSISSQEAIFWLCSKVLIGSQLALSINVPRTLLLQYSLDLNISGKVTLAALDKNKNDKQQVNIQLNRPYEIRPKYPSS